MLATGQLGSGVHKKKRIPLERKVTHPEMNPCHFSCIFHVEKELKRLHMCMDFHGFKGLLADD